LKEKKLRFMSYPLGQLVSAPLTNGFAGAEFGTHISYLGMGGYRELETLALRDAIPTKAILEYDNLGSGQRRHLMQVGVQETDAIYVLSIPGYSALSDADKLAALQDNANWVSLAEYLDVVIDDSNYAKLNRSNRFMDEQTVEKHYAWGNPGDPDTVYTTKFTGNNIEFNNPSEPTEKGLVNITGISNIQDVVVNGVRKFIYAGVSIRSAYAESLIVLQGDHVQSEGTVERPKDVVTLEYLNQALANVTGGEGITGFTREGNVLVLTTPSSEYRLDLNETTYGATANLLVDSDFQVPFQSNGGSSSTPGGYWLTNGGWTQSPGQANAQRGQYLFQDYYPTTNQLGDYVVRVVIDSIVNGTVTLVAAEVPTTEFTQPGTYEVPFTLTQTGVHRVHLFGNGLFDGVVSNVSVYSNLSIVQRPYGYNLFVHKEGAETIRGNKSFADAMLVTNDSFVTNKAQTLTVTDNTRTTQNSFIANFLTPNFTDNIFLTVGAQAGANGQSALFGFSKENGVPAVFVTSYGRPASDFKVLGTNGYVGMGTSMPTQRLTIVDGPSEIRLGSGSGSNTPTVSVINTSPGGKGTALVAGTGGSALFFSEEGYFAIASSPTAKFKGNNIGDGGDKTHAIIQGNGNVGIGTLNPTEKVEVAGNVKASKFIGDGSQLTNLAIAQNGNTGVVRVTNESNGLTVDNTGLLSLNISDGLSIDSDSGYLRVNFVTDIRPAGVDPNAVGRISAIKQYVMEAIAASGVGGTPSGTRIANAPIYTTTADGGQTVPLGATATGLVSVTVLEAGTTWARTIWEPYCTISGQSLTISTDAQLVAGDKILVKYYA
jgi:hypothetical protein